MILWVVLFVLVVAISFVLAARSMRDFTEVPQSNDDYSLFLIRKTQGLTLELLSSIHNELLKSNFIISFERLFKGNKSALVIFGPRKLLTHHQNLLDLLELEDYTDVNIEDISAWEAGIKSKINIQKIFTNLPQFLENDQFWWQIIISKGSKVQIRAIVITSDDIKRNSLTQTLHNLAPEKVIKLPKAFSSQQILEFYKLRSFRKDSENLSLSSEEILSLLLI